MSELPKRLQDNMNQWGQQGGKTEAKAPAVKIQNYLDNKKKTWFGTTTIRTELDMAKGDFQKGMVYLHQRDLIERWGGPDSAVRLTDKGKQDPEVWDE